MESIRLSQNISAQEICEQVEHRWKTAPAQTSLRTTWFLMHRDLIGLNDQNRISVQHWLERRLLYVLGSGVETVIRETLQLFRSDQQSIPEIEHWDADHLIAYVVVWAQPPEGFPKRHPFYFLDEVKGWYYLAREGEVFLQEHRAAIDPLIACQQERLAEWSRSAVSEILHREKQQMAKSTSSIQKKREMEEEEHSYGTSL